MQVKVFTHLGRPIPTAAGKAGRSGLGTPFAYQTEGVP
jgi:hypothetical protein